MKKLLFPEQISQGLGVLGNTYGMEVINLPNHRILHTCMTDLGRPREAKLTFSNSRWQLAPNARELGQSHFLHQTCIS